MFPTWSYLGLTYKPRSFPFLLGTVIFCILPAIWVPLFITRPTMIVYWILYLMTYIPMVIGISLAGYFTLEQVYFFNFTLLASFFLNGIGYKIRLYNLKRPYLNTKLLWSIVFIFSAFLFTYTVYIFRGNLKLVGLFSDRLYEARFSGREIEAVSVLVGYFILWLSNAMFPIMFGFGIVKKKYLLLIFSIIGQFILYMTMANKTFILSMGFMLFIFFIYKYSKIFGFAFTLILTAPLLFLSFTQAYLQGNVKLFFLPFSSLIVTRALATSTFTSIYYYDFFKDHPYTYFSHINIINKVIQYPYSDPLGIVVASQFSDIEKYNANATFYLTDGLAALGLLGMPLIAVICSILFYAIDSISKKQNYALLVMLLSCFSINLMNVSIFTSFLSGGLFLIILFLLYLKPSNTFKYN